MVNRNLIRGLDAGTDNWEEEIHAALGAESAEVLVAPGAEVSANQIISGQILRVDPEFVLVDVGYKSEGVIPRREWDEDEE
ncbi:MAG: S1 RNA-binding domain-containing protein, partial [Planctomycetales bacterium]|nr:S1 RNA-binding domain-containing protein [Planctomycetales bacterium]